MGLNIFLPFKIFIISLIIYFIFYLFSFKSVFLSELVKLEVIYLLSSFLFLNLLLFLNLWTLLFSIKSNSFRGLVLIVLRLFYTLSFLRKVNPDIRVLSMFVQIHIDQIKIRYYLLKFLNQNNIQILFINAK